jgi:uncharacterized protein YdbL (DUF1318 family)
MNRRMVLSALAGAAFLPVLGMPVRARAQGAGERLMAAKAAGKIGERPDGLVGAVGAAPAADVLQLVADINQKRRAQYAKIAAQNGTTAEQVGVVAGKELIDRTPAGQYVLNESGIWVKK